MNKYLLFFCGDCICSIDLTDEQKRNIFDQINWMKPGAKVYKVEEVYEQKH